MVQWLRLCAPKAGSPGSIPAQRTRSNMLQLRSSTFPIFLIQVSKLCVHPEQSTEWGGGVCAQSCPTLCNPMDYSPPGSFIHEILQARILE